MPEYARRTHHTTVRLEPGETRTYRLPPMTPGAVVVDASVASVVIPIRRGALPGLPARRAVTGATSLRDRAGVSGADLGLDIRLGTILDDGGSDLPTGPTPPTDLAMELVYGSRVVGTSSAHILFNASTKDDARELRLTRRAGGSGTATYVIEVNYPSVLPIIERRIAPSAFQRAFDANWNQHQYVRFEVSPDYHLHVTFDEPFRLLYGLENLDVDLGVPAAVPNMPRVTTSDIRFSIGHDWLPLGPPITPYQVPFVRLHVTMRVEGHGETWFDARFYLVSFGPHVEYLTKVTSPVINSIASQVPGVTVTDISRRIEARLDALGGQRFGTGFTPWLCGEPDRDMWGLTFDSGRGEIVAKYIGRPPPRSTEPTTIDPSRPPPPPPNSHPRLFDTPDELPPDAPGDGGPLPGSRYITSAGALAPIQHIVVLMQENRSFDQVLGYLSREAGRSDVDGLSPDPSSSQFNEYDGGDGNRIYRPQRAPETRWISFDTPGPCHEAECVRSQMADGMKHFVSNFSKRVHNDQAKLQRVMDYFGPDQLPAYAALARSGGICDRWFCSHIGPTWPNRFVMLTGDLNRDREGEPELNQPDFDRLAPITHRTVFDHLTERGVSWRLYEHGYSFLRLYGRYTFDQQNIASFTDPSRGFVADAAAGRLPQVTFIEPDYIDLPPGNDDHPPGDMADGQRLVATIASALLDSPTWDRTLLVITYDEAGGFYDHVWPPDGPPLAGNLRQYGPRVPAFVLSPFVAPGLVSHTVYDHTTILATILRRFCSPTPPRLSARADAANDLRDMLLPAPRPRTEFNALHDQMLALRNTAPPPPARARPLAPWTDAEDFHALLAYVRSFT